MQDDLYTEGQISMKNGKEKQNSNSLVLNSVFNIIYKGFTAIFPLITTVYVSRTLLPEDLGAITYANTIVSYFVILASLGIPNYGIKAIAQNSDSSEGRNSVYSELFLLNLVSTSFFILLYFCLVNNFQYFFARRTLFNIMGSMLVLNIFNIDWLFQGMEKYGIIALRGTIVRMLSFVLVLLFVKNQEDFLNYAIILCIGLAGNYILNVINSRKYVKFTFKHLNIKKHLKPVLILLASSIATEIYMMLDTVMIEYFKGEASVAYYSNAMKLVRTLYTLVIALVATFYPRISYFISHKDYERSNKLLRNGVEIVTTIAIPCSVGLFFGADHIVNVLYGDQYVSTIPILKVLGWLLIIFVFAYLLGHIVLMATGNEKSILRATICGAVTNAILNGMLIPKFGGVGAALASVSAELMVTSILIIQGSKSYTLHLNMHFLSSIVLSNIGLGVVLALVRNHLTYNILGLVCLIFIGIFTYAIFMLATKNDLILSLFKRLKSKIL